MKKYLCFFIFVSVIFFAGCSTDSAAVTNFLKGSTLLSASTETLGGKPMTIEQAVTETPDTIEETSTADETANSLVDLKANLVPFNGQQIVELYESNKDIEYLIVINLSTNKLTLYANGIKLCYFPVATGTVSNGQSKTPTGEFVITSHNTDPYWSGAGIAAPVAGGAPNNPLGHFWLGFAGNENYGIHGNIDEDSIGTYASHGCVRMHNWDIETLFNIVDIGTPVAVDWADELEALGYRYFE